MSTDHFCNRCGRFHADTTAGCMVAGRLESEQPSNLPVGRVTFEPASWSEPIIPLDTGTIHRAPLLAEIERLEAELRDLREAARAYREAVESLSEADAEYGVDYAARRVDAAERLSAAEARLHSADAALAALLPTAPEATP